jgi:hypothetical protein
MVAPLAFAGEPRTWQGELDGVPTWITVVPRGHDIPDDLLSQPWWQWGNTSTDAYLFAFNTPGDVRLILSFENNAGTPEARLYVEDSGASQVPHTLVGDDLRMQVFPIYRLRPAEGSWLIDGKTNYNLFGYRDGVEGKEIVAPDGRIDFEERVAALEPGVPAWSYSKMVNDPHSDWGYPRYGASQRMKDAPPFKVAAPLMPSFPHLGIARKPNHWFSENPPPIFFALEDFQFDLNNYVGFQTGGMFMINSVSGPPDTNFENPFAFYTFAPDTRHAQLVVRGGYTPPKDRFRGLVARNVPKVDFRYSWKTSNNNRWQFGLSVAGTYPYTELVRVGPEAFYSVQPEVLPNWIMDKSWPVVSFVEAVNGMSGSEGIYFYSAQARPVWPWVVGVSAGEPAFFAKPFLQEDTLLGKSPDESIPAGFRGEYHSAYNQIPKLYFSPLDNRVHLLGAQGGIWNLGGGRILRSHSRFGSPYLNGWTRERIPEQSPEDDVSLDFEESIEESGEEVIDEFVTDDLVADGETETDVFLPKALPGEIEAAFYALGNYLLYAADNQEVVVRKASYTLSSLELNPPKDKASWETFVETLEPYAQTGRDPENMRAWLEAFPGPSFTLERVSVQDINVTDDSLSLVLDLPEDVRASSTLPELTLDEVAAGSYVLRYEQNQWRFERAAPRIPELSLTVTGGQVFTDNPNDLTLSINNPSNLDVSGEAALVIAGETVKTWSRLEVEKNSSVQEHIVWIPHDELRGPAVLTWGDDTFELADLTAVPKPRDGSLRLLELSFGGALPGLLFLLVVMTAVGFLYRRVWQA